MTSSASYFFRNARDRAASAGPRDSGKTVPAKRPEPTLEQLLAFEAKNPRPGDRKGERIRAELGITPVRYFQLLARNIWSEEALQADPMTTNRLRKKSIERKAEQTRRVARD